MHTDPPTDLSLAERTNGHTNGHVSGNGGGGGNGNGSGNGIERLFEMTSDLLAEISLDGRFTLLNPAWEQVLGWSIEELMAQPMHERMHPDDVEETQALMLAGSHRPAQLENFTNRYRHRDGSWRSLLWSARCDGEVWTFVQLSPAVHAGLMPA